MRTMRRNYTDAEVVEGIWRARQVHGGMVLRFGTELFRTLFQGNFLRQRPQTGRFSQTAFPKIWTEMDNGTISVSDGNVVRRRHTGEVMPMTCSLLYVRDGVCKDGIP